MSDNLDEQSIDFNESDAGAQGAAAAKRKNPPILRILAFVGIGLLAVGLIITVVFVVIGLMGDKGEPLQGVPQGINFTTVPPPYEYSGVLATVNTMSNDPPSDQAVVRVSFKLAFVAEDKSIPEEISKRKDKLDEVVLFYFMDKSAAELQDKQRVKSELLELINTHLSRPAIKEVIIKEYTIMKP